MKLIEKVLKEMNEGQYDNIFAYIQDTRSTINLAKPEKNEYFEDSLGYILLQKNEFGKKSKPIVVSGSQDVYDYRESINSMVNLRSASARKELGSFQILGMSNGSFKMGQWPKGTYKLYVMK